ncbi:MAG: sucrase ferredoxin [Thermodesulfobacteriota bacterium]
MTDKNYKHFSCSELSLNAREELFATAPRVDVWFLLEYRGAWTDKALLDSKIPEDVKKQINLYLETITNSRLQFIKRHDNSGDTLKFYVAKSDESEPKLYEVDLRKYEELLELDLSKMLGNGLYLRKEPLFLICTNGEYDKCCGKYGARVYLEAVKNENGFMIWQTTHLGGHRFAANLLHLPSGIYYGRVGDVDVHRLIKEATNCKIDLEHYRGRTCYSKEVQAAEYFLRNLTGETEISAFQFKEAKNMGKENLIFEFNSKWDGKNHLVQIKKDKSALMNFTSCKDREKSPIAQYRLIDCKSL